MTKTFFFKKYACYEHIVLFVCFLLDGYLNHPQRRVGNVALRHFGQRVDEHGAQLGRLVVHHVDVRPPGQQLLRDDPETTGKTRDDPFTVLLAFKLSFLQRFRNHRRWLLYRLHLVSIISYVTDVLG